MAAGCSLTHKDGVSLFRFPKDPTLRKKWADQVKRTRAKWEPSDYSVLCSKHFADHCFHQDSKLSESMGLGKRKARLKSEAIPTLFDKPVTLKRKSPASETPVIKKRRGAFEKRERYRVSFFAYSYMHIIIHVALLQIIDAVMETEDIVGSSNAITDSEMVCCKKSDCT